MGARGKKSSAALSVIGVTKTGKMDRPLAPVELTDEQTEEWNCIVDRMAADWFTRETHALLAQYCRHIIRARRMAQLIDAAEKEEDVDVKTYRDLLKSEEEQSRAISSLATKMRLTQQTTYDKSKKKPFSGKKTWE